MRNLQDRRKWLPALLVTVCCAPGISRAITLTSDGVRFARLDTPFLTSNQMATSVPLSGFVPQMVFGLTDAQDPNDTTFSAVASSSPVGNALPTSGTPYYSIATFDTGSEFDMVDAADASIFNLDAAGRAGGYSIQIVGASGTEYADISDALGVYATGFGNATSNGTAVSLNPGSPPLQGQWNTSILSGEAGSELPNLIGAPMAAQYQTVITNSKTKELVVGGQTYISPEMNFQALDTPLPSNYVRLSLDVQSPLGISPTPTYFPSFDNFSNVADNPSSPTSWASFLANVNLTGTGGSASNQPFLLDTGSQVTVLSEDTAAALGFYSAGPNASTPDFYVEITGVGGTTEVPGFYVPTLSVMTNGGPIVWNNVPAIVLDLTDPRDDVGYIPGVLGMNLFTDRDLIVNGGIADPSLGIGPQLSPQWVVDADGNWGDGVSDGYAYNWIDGDPNGIDAPANFLGAISQPRTVTVDANYTVGSITFDNSNRYTIAGPGTLTLQTSTGPASIHVISGSHTISAPLTFANDTNLTVDSASSTLTISGGIDAAGVTTTKTGPGTVAVGGSMSFGNLAVQQGKLVFSPHSNVATRMASLTVDSGATVDVTDNSLVIDYVATYASPLSALSGLIAAAYDSGKWDRPGIASSSAAANSATALGIADNSVLGLSSFRGQNVSGDDVLISYTWYGDANLDGKVDAADLALFAANGSAATWSTGDFNYDGVVNADDYALYALGYAAQTGNFPISVPEPAIMGSVAVLFTLRRRRNRTTNQHT